MEDAALDFFLGVQPSAANFGIEVGNVSSNGESLIFVDQEVLATNVLVSEQVNVLCKEDNYSESNHCPETEKTTLID